MIDIHLIAYNNLEDKDLFIKFCEQASRETSQPASVNMWHKNWKSKPETLVFQIYNRKRFFENNGEFYLALANKDIIGCSGVYRSLFSDNIALAGCRTWIDKDYRNLSIPREYFLPQHKKWAYKNNFKILALSFNDYNRNLIKTFTRLRLGENRSPRKEYHMFYNNFNEVLYPVTIQYVKQWVIYEKLQEDWDFDWSTISYIE